MAQCNGYHSQTPVSYLYYFCLHVGWIQCISRTFLLSVPQRIAGTIWKRGDGKHLSVTEFPCSGICWPWDRSLNTISIETIQYPSTGSQSLDVGFETICGVFRIVRNHLYSGRWTLYLLPHRIIRWVLKTCRYTNTKSWSHDVCSTWNDTPTSFLSYSLFGAIMQQLVERPVLEIRRLFARWKLRSL